MAEINIPAASGKKGGRKRKVLSTKVDLTPMVDLGFLLITFFIFTMKMSEPQATDLKMPADGPPSKIGNSNVLTVLPLADNKVFYYHGELNEALKTNLYGYTNYNVKTGLGEVIREKQIALDRSGTGRKELMLLIKPSENSIFSNTIDVLDEVLINDVKRYALVDISQEEIKALADKNAHL